MNTQKDPEFFITKDKKRGKRIYKKNELKRKAKEKLKASHDPKIYTEEEINYYVDDRAIGLFAETPARCRARCCSNPRKFGKKSLKEIKNLHNYQSQLEDLFLEE